MPMKYLLKRGIFKSVLLLVGMVITITLFPLAIDHANLANEQDSVNNENILYFPAINPGKDLQTSISITNTECKSKQRQVKATLTAYENDGSSLGVVKDITRLRANKTKTINAQTLPPGAKSMTVKSDGNLIGNTIFKTKDGTKSEVVQAIEEPSSQLYFPALASYDDLYIYETITLLNPNTAPASVDIIALDKDGYEIDHDTLSTLSSMESRDITLVDIFNGNTLKNLSTVRVVSDSDIVGFQLMDYPAVDLVGLPALTTTSKVWRFPIVTKGENLELWTKVGIINPGNDTAYFTVEAFDSNNNSLGIIYNQKLFPGATYFLSTENANIADGVIPLNTAFLKVTSDQPVSGYEIIGVVDGNGLTAIMGIPEEDQTTVGFEITGSRDGGVLTTYPMIRIGDENIESSARSLENGEWSKEIRSNIFQTDSNSETPSQFQISLPSTTIIPTANIQTNNPEFLEPAQAKLVFFREAFFNTVNLTFSLKNGLPVRIKVYKTGNLYSVSVSVYENIPYEVTDIDAPIEAIYIGDLAGNGNPYLVLTTRKKENLGIRILVFRNNRWEIQLDKSDMPNGQLHVIDNTFVVIMKQSDGSETHQFFQYSDEEMSYNDHWSTWVSAKIVTTRVTGAVDDGINSAEEAALHITAFNEGSMNPWDGANQVWNGNEGYKYGQTSTNWDGGLLSYGLKQWNFWSGTLPPLLRSFEKENSDAFWKVFNDLGLDTTAFRNKVISKSSTTKSAYEWAVTKVLGGSWKIFNKKDKPCDGYNPDTNCRWIGGVMETDWKTAFSKLGDIAEFQEIQRKNSYDKYLKPTKTKAYSNLNTWTKRTDWPLRSYLVLADLNNQYGINKTNLGNCSLRNWIDNETSCVRNTSKSLGYNKDISDQENVKNMVSYLETSQYRYRRNAIAYGDGTIKVNGVFPAWDSYLDKYSVYMNEAPAFKGIPYSSETTDKTPSISITYPTDGTTVSGIVTVSANATDDKGINKVEFYLDSTLKFTDTSPSYTWSWDTTQSTNGSHTLKAIAYDTTGQTATSQISVTVNNTTTSIAVTSFKINNDAASTTSQTVTLNNTATGSPTQYMASESSSFSAASWQTYSNSTAPSFTLSSSNGTKTVYFKVKNSSGTESAVVSDSIILSVSCTYSINPTTQSFGSSGGSGSVSVTTQSGCNWTAVSNNTSWITITSGSSGSGNGTVYYSVAANSSASSRTGTMTIAGNTFTVTQSGTSCTYSISPTSKSFDSNGGSGSVTVTTQSGCNWTTTSNTSWITITSGSSGTGSGTVNYSVAANTSTSSRTGTITITGGNTFTVTQTGTGGGALPDLTSSATVASSYTSGQAGVQIPVTVYRTGGNLTQGTYVHAKLYWSTDSTSDTGDSIKWSSNDSTPDFPNSVLNSSGSKTVTATMDIPSVSAGTYYIISYADAPTSSYSNGYHSESNENNNTKSYSVSILAGLSITSINPSSATKGTTVTFTLTGTGFQSGFAAKLINELNVEYDVSSTQFVSSTTVKVTIYLGSGPTSTQYIKITNTDGQSAQISFQAIGDTAITVTSPNGGESWKVGTTRTISWTYTGSPGDYVKIEILKGGSVNSTITTSTSIGSSGSGSYSWTISSSQTAGSDYKVRVTSTSNSSYTDTSDSNFTISSETLSITAISPSSAIKGTSVTFTLTGTGFQSGFTAKLINELNVEYDVSSTQFVSSTTVKVTVYLGSGSTSTQYIKITNPDGQSAQISFQAIGNTTTTVSYQGHFANTGWGSWLSNGATCGTAGGNQMEAIKITTSSYGIQYRAHVAYDGWLSWVSDGGMAGTTGQSKSLQAIEIKLTNAPSNLHVSYRVYVHGQGWQGWVSDGSTAGTTGQSLAVEAIEIKLENW